MCISLLADHLLKQKNPERNFREINFYKVKHSAEKKVHAFSLQEKIEKLVTKGVVVRAALHAKIPQQHIQVVERSITITR